MTSLWLEIHHWLLLGQGVYLEYVCGGVGRVDVFVGWPDSPSLFGGRTGLS